LDKKIFVAIMITELQLIYQKLDGFASCLEPFSRNAIKHDAHNKLPSIFLEFPVPIVERTDLTCLEPTRDAVKMEGVLDMELAVCHG